MEFRLKPFGFVLLLLITTAAIIFDFTEWTQVRVATHLAEGKGSGHLVLLASSAGNGWLQKQVDRFNSQNKGKVDIKIRYKDAPAALNAILSKKETPALWAPGSAEWVGRLDDVWSKEHQGQNLVGVADGANFRTYLRSPLVLVSKKVTAPASKSGAAGKAAATGSPAAAAVPAAGLAVSALGIGSATGPTGAFASRRVAFADPGSSNAGRVAVGMILSNYALRNGGSADDLDTVAKSASFLQFLRGLHDTPVSDSFTKTGGPAVLDAFVHNPKLYDVVVASESDALAAAAKDPALVVSYPSPTCVEEQSVAVLSGAHWVSPEERAAAQNFLKFLSSSESLSDGVKAHFRPAHPTAHLTLAPDLKAMSKQGFRQVYDSVDALPYLAAEDAAHAWRVAAAGAEARPAAKIVAYARL